MIDRNSGDEDSSSHPVLLRAYDAYGRVKLLGAVTSGAMIMIMMLLIVADVASRNFRGGSLAGTFEFVENYFMPLAVFPALGYVYGSGVLPRMELLADRLGRRSNGHVTNALLVLDLLLFGVLAYFSLQYAIAGMGGGSGFTAATRLFPVWPIYFLIPLGFSMIMIETVFVLVNNILTGKQSFAMHRDSVLPAL